MIASATKTGITLKLTDSEALQLAAFLGRSTVDPFSSWYDPIADAVESKTETEVYEEDGISRNYIPISELVDNDPEASRIRGSITF